MRKFSVSFSINAHYNRADFPPPYWCIANFWARLMELLYVDIILFCDLQFDVGHWHSEMFVFTLLGRSIASSNFENRATCNSRCHLNPLLYMLQGFPGGSLSST